MAYVPARYTRTPVPSPAVRHVLSRFTAGWNPALQRQVQRRGGIDAWFRAQVMRPGSFPDGAYRNTADWWTSIDASAETIFRRDRTGVEGIWSAAANYQRWSMVRRVKSQRQVQETMAAFWENHLHVPATGESPAMFRAAYGKAIRRRALGRFADVLYTATTHPAMGCYLDNARSSRRAPNENLGRELLELHTVGRESGYTEDDVKASARILTGWRVDTWDTWRVWYEPNDHWTGRVRVLGFRHANADPDGRAVTRAYTNYLARHPATARRIARKLAVRFVSDSPPPRLVDRLARVYLENDTDIRPVLLTLKASDAFRRSRGQKLPTPEEELIATYRALRIGIRAPEANESFANAMLWQCDSLGLRPYAWPRPDGRPDSADDWASTSRVLATIEAHHWLSRDQWPSRDAVFRPRLSWIPDERLRFDMLVDHLARRLTGRVSTASLLQACCEATGYRPENVVSRSTYPDWKVPALLATVLDSPLHVTR